MRKWKHKIDLGPFTEAVDVGTVCQRAVDALEPLRETPDWDPDLEEIQEDFADLAEENGAMPEDFNILLESLYNWGDLGKRLWVET